MKDNSLCIYLRIWSMPARACCKTSRDCVSIVSQLIYIIICFFKRKTLKKNNTYRSFDTGCRRLMTRHGQFNSTCQCAHPRTALKRVGTLYLIGDVRRRVDQLQAVRSAALICFGTNGDEQEVHHCGCGGAVRVGERQRAVLLVAGEPFATPVRRLCGRVFEWNSQLSWFVANAAA